MSGTRGKRKRQRSRSAAAVKVVAGVAALIVFAAALAFVAALSGGKTDAGKESEVRVLNPEPVLMAVADERDDVEAYTEERYEDEDTEEAKRLNIALTAKSSGGLASLDDTDYDTTAVLDAGDTLSIASKEEQDIGAIYIQWWREPDSFVYEYTTGAGDVRSFTVERGFMHHYIRIKDEGVREVRLTVPKEIRVCNVAAYTSGRPPEGVQEWREPCADGTDLLVFSAHADDEVLFMGGVLATYSSLRGYRTQVVYLTNYWSGLRKREHEKLDGLWELGIRNYPVNGRFDDEWATDLAAAERIYSYDEVEGFVAEQIRRFRPQVVVSHDFNGEYGHGGHCLLAKAVAEAVNNCADESFHAESSVKYGTWDVAKTYFHLYDKNRITMNLREPIEELGGRTAVEAAADAYARHVSQQWCWFYVSDDAEDEKAEQINCAEFGLYRTTVGEDSGNDMFENITTYDEWERIEKEERLAAEEESAAVVLWMN